MAELAAILQNESGTVILMGDLNDTPGSPMYQVLAGAGFVDVWASLQPGQSGYTCCHTTDLHSGSFSQRIDYVMVRGGFLNDDGQVVGGGRIQVIGEKAEEQVNGAFGLIWPSDHGGVVVSLPPAR
jgi:endonuclease/exonuclease/phosphatase family metal-dependent hydrolase